MTRVQGHGGELEHVETYRGTTVQMGLSEKVRFEVAVSDSFVEQTIEALCNGARATRPASDRRDGPAGRRAGAQSARSGWLIRQSDDRRVD
jgi:hypothetical protein